VGFGLFLMVTAVLFIRPTDFIPALEAVPLYEILIITCTAASFDKIVDQLSGGLAKNPISACVLGLFAAVVMSNLANMNVEGAVDIGFEFTKVVIYYLLLVGNLNSPQRLRSFLLWLALCVTVVNVIGVLQYYGYIHLESFAVLESSDSDEIDPETGQTVVALRLRGTGLFHDPNQLCTILNVAIPLAVYGLGDRRAGPKRRLWLGPLLLFVLALQLTKSRGGLMGTIAAILVLLRARYRGRGMLILGGLILPPFLIVFGGRQTNFSVSGGSGHQRLELWYDAFEAILKNPLFGIGTNQFVEMFGRVAHNAFIQGFAEMGFFGGSLFLGAYLHALLAVYRLDPDRAPEIDPELTRMRPCVLAAVAGYAVNMMTLSLNYIVPTYTILGIAAGLLQVAEAEHPGAAGPTGFAFVRRTVVAAAVYLALMFVYTRVMMR